MAEKISYRIILDMNRIFPRKLFIELFGEDNIVDNYEKYCRDFIDDYAKDSFNWLVKSLKDCNIELSYRVIHIDNQTTPQSSAIFDNSVSDTLARDYNGNENKQYQFYQATPPLPAFLHKLVEDETIEMIRKIILKVKYTYQDLMEAGKIKRSGLWNRFSLFRNEDD